MSNIAASIPLSTAYQLPTQIQQANIPAAMDAGYKMASDMDAGQQGADEINDRRIAKMYLQQGGNLDTPEGVQKALDDLKGQVSPQGYQKLVQQQQNLQDYAAKLQGTDIQTLQTRQMLLGTVIQSMQAPLNTYFQEAQSKGTQGALQDFDKVRNQVLMQISQIKNPVTGKPLLDPAMTKELQTASPQMLQSELQTALFMSGQIQKVMQVKLQGSQIDKNEAAANLYNAGRGWAMYTDQQGRSVRVNPNTGMVERQTENGWEPAPDVDMRTLTRVGGSVYNQPPVPFQNLSPTQQQGVEAQAWNYIMTGHNPPARGGSYNQVMSYVAQIAQSNGMTIPDLMAKSGDVKAQIHSLSSFENRVTNLTRVENQLHQELPVMEDYVDQIDLSKYPMLNHIKLAALRQLGDPTVAKMDQSAQAVFNEFQSAMTGNPGALNVADVQEAQKEYYQLQSPQQLKAWIQNAYRMIDRAKQAAVDSRSELQKQISGNFRGQGAVGAPGAGSTPNAQNTQIPPNVQADRDAEARQLMEQELQQQQQNLAKATTPQAKQLAQANIQALQNELQQYGGAQAAPAPTSTPSQQAPTARPPAPQEWRQALDWANTHPNDPRAKEILQKYKSQQSSMVQVQSPQQLAQAYRAGQLQIGSHFIGPDGKTYELTQEPTNELAG